MTTPNELISMLRAKGCPDWVTARWLMESAADLLQSQAERIKVIERESEMRRLALHDVMLESDQLRAQLADAELHTKQVERGLDKATAQLAEIAAIEPVFYEYQWTKPRKQPHQPESMFVWARVEPEGNGTVQQKVDELLAYRYNDKPTYRVRALFARPMPAQGVEASMIKLPEPVAWFANYGGNVYTEAQLKQAVRDALDTQGVTELVEALEMIVSTHQGHCEHHVGVSKHSYNLADIAEEALSKYKGAK